MIHLPERLRIPVIVIVMIVVAMTAMKAGEMKQFYRHKPQVDLAMEIMSMQESVASVNDSIRSLVLDLEKINQPNNAIVARLVNDNLMILCSKDAVLEYDEKNQLVIISDLGSSTSPFSTE